MLFKRLLPILFTIIATICSTSALACGGDPNKIPGQCTLSISNGRMINDLVPGTPKIIDDKDWHLATYDGFCKELVKAKVGQINRAGIMANQYWVVIDSASKVGPNAMSVALKFRWGGTTWNTNPAQGERVLKCSCGTQGTGMNCNCFFDCAW